MAEVDNLKVYQRAHRLALHVYAVTGQYPKSERFGLVHQMRRAAVSVPSNLAEGYGRGSDGELRRFTNIALGSLNELRYQVRLSADLAFIDRDTSNELTCEVTEIRRMLHGLKERLDPSGRTTTQR